MGQDEFGSDFISVLDEDGNEIELEVIKAFEVGEQEYTAFLPADMDEDDPDYGYIILKNIEEDGEEIFGSVDDDAELEVAYNTFISLLFDDEEEE
ncbi:MAG: DUF1292 domain-containing protein [Candidatus Heteroscillospira sp.]|jgi:uncharacterized protein YrzB (UPF0473 family)